MADLDRIIDKIKKCLALSKSSNEHEAQAALRQAQKLMQMHDVSEAEVHASEAEEHRTRAGAISKPSKWENYLAGTVSRAFGCEVILTYNVAGNHGEWAFVGCAPSVEIAKYAFDVMFRKVKRARADYIKGKLKRCGPANRTRRADLFCEGWVLAATRAIEAFKGTPEQLRAIECFKAAKYTNLTDVKATDRNAGRNLSVREEGDHWAGYNDGRDAELNRGIGGSSPELLEG